MYFSSLLKINQQDDFRLGEQGIIKYKKSMYVISYSSPFPTQ